MNAVAMNNQGNLPFRLTKPETTQFFQFDQKGNMYVFAPGAGCTGAMRLVKPGDELIYYSSYNPLDWATEISVKTEKEDMALPATCPGGVNTSGCEFKPPLPEENLIDLGHKNFSSKTMKQVRWVRKMYREWRQYRHNQGFAFIQCDLEDKATITAESLKYAMCCFITEVKKANGQDFPGKTLYHIVVCVQFHLECLGFAFKLINDPAFHDLKFTLHNTMKARVCQGIGLTVKKSEVITSTDEDLLWSFGLLGTNSPEQLLNTVIFSVGKGFALRAGKEHRALCAIPFASQFKFMADPDGEIFLRYTEDIGLKTNKGGLKHRCVEAKTVDLYASQNPDRCPLWAIIKYLALLPKNRTCSAFYLQPQKKFFGKAWFINRPVGINCLRTAVGDLCMAAGLPGHYTNHSLSATMATKLYQNNIDEQIIMEITGHGSMAIQTYKRTSDAQRK